MKWKKRHRRRSHERRWEPAGRYGLRVRQRAVRARPPVSGGHWGLARSGGGPAAASVTGDIDAGSLGTRAAISAVVGDGANNSDTRSASPAGNAGEVTGAAGNLGYGPVNTTVGAVQGGADLTVAFTADGDAASGGGAGNRAKPVGNGGGNV